MSRPDVLPPRPERRRRRRVVRALLLAALGALLLLVVGGAVAYARTDIPEPDELAVAGVTRVLYSDGTEMGRVGGQNRIPVPLEEVPEHVQAAVLAAEDRGFYDEPGISPRGIARALFTNLRGGGEIQQGGSTITQQYAKNAFLSTERTYSRKIKEIFLALKMTREKSKQEILEDYLNTIYFGRGAYGVQVAASTYFGKPLEDLTPAEGAVLASSIRSPANYDPERHPERAQQRWRYVVDGMVATGALGQGEAAVLEYPAVKPAAEAGRHNDLSGPKGHVIAKVMDEVEDVLAERGEQEVLTTGVVVTTTVRRDAQDAAVSAVQAVVGQPAEGDPDAPKGALVSIEPTTGAVVAYYGGATGTGFDYASQGTGRQPGSSFKPFALAAGLEEGISLRSTFDGNSPKKFPGIREGVRNFGDRDYGRVDLLRATEQSVNTAYFELGLEVGPKKVEEVAKRVGITTPLGDGNPEGGISLGIYDVRVLDQARAYAAFANGGQRVQPYFVQKVEDGDRELYSSSPSLERVLSDEVAADVTAALQRVVQSGTGTRARLTGGRPAAGKTGTTSDNYDVWFAGYTPQLSTAVWIGTGSNRTIELRGVREATGGVVAAGIWKQYTDAASKGLPVERFPRPANVGSTRNGTTEPTQAPRSTAPQTAAPSTSPPAPSPTSTPEPEESEPPAPTPSASGAAGGGGNGGVSGNGNGGGNGARGAGPPGQADTD